LLRSAIEEHDKQYKKWLGERSPTITMRETRQSEGANFPTLAASHLKGTFSLARVLIEKFSQLGRMFSMSRSLLTAFPTLS
jgi:hypothetical protein